jgi:Response regulator of the LytR/AlgR family
MKVLIVEDETSAYDNLKEILMGLGADIEIVGYTESVTNTVNWLQTHSLPDLIFMDIHLSDDSAFRIFDRMEVETPIIFTTAYDQYAIDAFKVNSIDYLLKPIKATDIKRAIEKYNKLTRVELTQYLARLVHLAPLKEYRDKLLVPYKDKLIPVSLNNISFFYTTEKNTTIYLKNGQSYPYAKTLEQVMALLNPKDFFRANKQFLIKRESVNDITIWFDSRLLLTLDVAAPERIYVSKNKAADFKAWMMCGY